MRRLTTRKPVGAAVLAVAVTWFLTGCATPGPAHLYMAGAGMHPVFDRALGERDAEPAELAGFVGPRERVVGLAYEFNTDYLWLRLAPGHVLRVVNRPARRVERELVLDATVFGSAGPGSLDLATRSADRRVYAALAGSGGVAELTHLGREVRRWVPGGEARPIGGLAYDQREDVLLVLYRSPVEIVGYDRGGAVVRRVVPGAGVRPTTLAYDSDGRRYFLPLGEESRMVGEFDAAGVLVGRWPAPAGEIALDAGARSLVRVF